MTKTGKPVVVLRDTSAAQTALLNSVLPLSYDTDLHKSVLVECMEIQVINHYHYTKCV